MTHSRIVIDHMVDILLALHYVVEMDWPSSAPRCGAATQGRGGHRADLPTLCGGSGLVGKHRE